MGRPPLVLRKEDYPSTGLGTKDALDTLFQPLNSALAALQGSADSALAQGRNLEWKTLEFTAPTTGWTPLNVKTDVARPQAVLLAQLVDTTEPTAIPAPAGFWWAPGPGASRIQVKNLSGVTPGHAYQLTLLVLGG